MHIRRALLFAIFLLPHIAQASAEQEGEGKQLYKSHCSSCHGNTGGMDMHRRVAPPIFAVRMHYIGSYPDKASFVAAVSSWVEQGLGVGPI